MNTTLRIPNPSFQLTGARLTHPWQDSIINLRSNLRRILYSQKLSLSLLFKEIHDVLNTLPRRDSIETLVLDSENKRSQRMRNREIAIKRTSMQWNRAWKWAFQLGAPVFGHDGGISALRVMSVFIATIASSNVLLLLLVGSVTTSAIAHKSLFNRKCARTHTNKSTVRLLLLLLLRRSNLKGSENKSFRVIPERENVRKNSWRRAREWGRRKRERRTLMASLDSGIVGEIRRSLPLPQAPRLREHDGQGASHSKKPRADRGIWDW